MNPLELRAALAQQQAENAALRAELAACRAASTAAPGFVLPSLLGYLAREEHKAVVLVNEAGHICFATPGLAHLYGQPVAQVLGRRPEHLLWPAVPEAASLAALSEQLQATGQWQFETAYPRPDAEKWLAVKVRPVADVPGVRYVAVLEDVTADRQARQLLTASEARFRSLAENVPGALYEWRKLDSGEYFFDYASPKVREIFGIDPEGLSRMTDFIHPDELEAFGLQLDYATRHRLPWEYEGRLVVPGQPLRWFRGNSIVTGQGPGWVRYSGILLDITPLKKAEAALRESTMRWKLAMEGFGDGTWESDLRTSKTFFSQEYQAMLGYTNTAFADRSQNPADLVHPDDFPVTMERLQAYLAGHAPGYSDEVRLRCADGTYKWVLARVMITARDAAGRPTIITGSNTDISALKRVQETLAATSQRLSTVIDNFREGIVLEDEHRRVMLANEAFCRGLALPRSPAQLVGLNGAQLVRESLLVVAEPGAYQARIADILARRELVLGDVLELRSGKVLQRDYIPVHDARGRYLGQLWKFRDVTARTRAEAELRRREEKYRGIIENMSLGLVEADLDDHLIYANQSFCTMTGFSSEELAGQRLSPLLLDGDDLALVESKLRTRQQGVADSYEIAVTTRTGERKWLLVSGAPLYDAQQRHVGSIGIYLDVTPQKQLEARLREAKAAAEVSTRAKQDFLANMSHEIRTPMNAILGMGQLLQKTGLDATQASYLHAITASADTLLVIVNDILDLSKIEAGRLHVERIGFSPAQLGEQIEKTLRFKAEEKGLEFEVWLDPAVPPVLVSDPHRLAQVLLNLTGNAIKFTEAGRVRLRIGLLDPPTPREARLEFVVEDTGIGIDADYLRQIFDEFSQEDSSVSRRFGGTGLGLGISQKLVGLLGGELRIESTKQVGTVGRFELVLPIGHARSLPQREYDNLDHLRDTLHGKRVLLVEDNYFNRLLATSLLGGAGIEVVEAINGQVAVELARQTTPDLVLMDVQMPVQNGYEATRQLRQELRLTVPIVALTANAIVGERDKCLAAGMNDYLTKPFQEVSLLKMVYKWVVGFQAAAAEPAVELR